MGPVQSTDKVLWLEDIFLPRFKNDERNTWNKHPYKKDDSRGSQWRCDNEPNNNKIRKKVDMTTKTADGNER